MAFAASPPIRITQQKAAVKAWGRWVDKQRFDALVMVAPVVLTGARWLLGPDGIKLGSGLWSHRQDIAAAVAQARDQWDVATSEQKRPVARFLQDTFPRGAVLEGRTGDFGTSRQGNVDRFKAIDGREPDGARIVVGVQNDRMVSIGLLAAVARHRRKEALVPEEAEAVDHDHWGGSGFVVGGPIPNPLAASYLDWLAAQGDRFGFATGIEFPVLQTPIGHFEPTMDKDLTDGLDYGLLVRLPNYWRPQNQVVLAMGCLRHGTEAAAALVTRPDLTVGPSLREIRKRYRRRSFWAVVCGRVEGGTLRRIECVTSGGLPKADAWRSR